jgi:[acyl-carrier-protein] S-malonyltransferase
MGGPLILFPGQGSQYAGMAEYLWDYPVARTTFAEAGEVLGWDIGELCRHGSMEELTRTDRTQLTLLTCSVAVWRLLEEREASFVVAAGHSLGEYPALVATGQLAFADALRVVEARGLGMQACSEERDGAMAAVVGLETEAVEELCASLPEVWPANYNSPGQVVISGSAESVKEAGELARSRGAKLVVALPVSGAFHTPFMAGAAASLSKALGLVKFTAGRSAGTASGESGGHVPGDDAGGRFFSTTEVRYPEPGELAEVLARQLMSPVRFSQSMTAILQGAAPPDRGLEVGPGNVLTGLMKRIDRDFPMSSTGDAENLRKVLDGLPRAGHGVPADNDRGNER